MTDSLENSKAVVRQFFAAIETNDAKAFDALVAEGYLDHLSGQAPGRETLKRYVASLHEGIGDLAMPILDMVAEDDKVAVLNKVEGIHRGELFGRPATGNRIDITNFQLYRLEDGRLAEHWEVADFATLTAQLSSGGGGRVA